MFAKKLVTQDHVVEKFDDATKELYAVTWQHILLSATIEALCKEDLFNDPNFNIEATFKELSKGKVAITRDDLAEALDGEIDD